MRARKHRIFPEILNKNVHVEKQINKPIATWKTKTDSYLYPRWIDAVAGIRTRVKSYLLDNGKFSREHSRLPS